jgi:multiple sugar transport system ATP-binding protein
VAEIVLDHVTKEFGENVKAVDDVSLTIGDGEFMVLVGPSGCGKTTLLRSVGGLETISSGQILIDGHDVSALAPGDRDLAMVFQNYALYPHMTVRENLGYSLRVHKRPKPEITRRVDQVAQMLGLVDLLDRRPRQLSGGQQQRVAMGRAIIRQPAGFLMDEPLSNLDAKLRVSMRASLQELHHRLQTTTIYVTHDQVEAMTLGQRVAVMRDGRVQQADTPQNLYRHPANVFVAAFIGSPAMNLARGRLVGDRVEVGGTSIPLPDGPGWAAPGEVVVGIRPEGFADAALARPGLPVLETKVRVLEDLGSEVHVFFEVDAEPVVVEAARSDDPDNDLTLLTQREQALFVARVDARTEAQVGSGIRLAVHPDRVYLFSPTTGENLLDGPQNGGRAPVGA